MRTCQGHGATATGATRVMGEPKGKATFTVCVRRIHPTADHAVLYVFIEKNPRTRGPVLQSHVVQGSAV